MLRKFTRRAGVVALALAALTLVPATPALAKKAETVELVPPGDTGETDASGKVKIVHRKRGDRMVVRIKKLARHTVYNVVDADTGEVLGSIRTNKRGRGRLVLTEGRSTLPGKVAAIEELPDHIDIVADGDDARVLETEADPLLLVGLEEYTGDAGDKASITLISIPARPESDMMDIECFILSLAPPLEEGEGFPDVSYALMLDSVTGDDMPLGVDHASELAERAFEIRDGNGTVWVAGDLPAVVGLDENGPGPGPEDWVLPEMDDVPNWRDGSDRDDGSSWNGSFTYPQPVEYDVTLWIADEDGILTRTHNLLRIDLPDLPGSPGFPGFPERDAPTGDDGNRGEPAR